MKDLYALFRQSLAGLRAARRRHPAARGRLPARRHGRRRRSPSPWQAPRLAGHRRRASTRPTPTTRSARRSSASSSTTPGCSSRARRPPATATTRSSTYGSNLGPENPDLLAAIKERRAEIAEREGVDPADVPPDAVTASGSGLDPDISPAYAELQVPRVAPRRTGSTEEQVRDLVDEHTSGRTSGVLGEPRVNVLDAQHRRAAAAQDA